MLTHVRIGLVALIAGVALVAVPPRVMAQEATPEPEIMAAHPAHIHRGTCEELGEVVYPLEDITLAPEAEGTPVAGPMMIHAVTVETSVTTVEVSLADLLAESHAINVHESMENLGNSITCGEIAGRIRMHLRGVAPPGLVIGLRELNDSGYTGIAWLQPNEDGTTTVTIFLAQGLIGRGPRMS